MVKGYKLVLATALLLVVILPIVSASTPINVRTLPDHKVSVSVLAADEVYSLLDSYHIMADSNGQVSTNYDGGAAAFKLIVKIAKDGTTVALEKFDGKEFTAGTPLYLLVKPGEVNLDYAKLDAEAAAAAAAEAAANASQNESTLDIVPLAEESGSSITGGAISAVKDVFLSKLTYYIVGGIIGCGLILLLIFKVAVPYAKKRKANVSSFTPRAYVSPLKSSSDSSLVEPSVIEAAEKKLADAQAEINRIKNQDKIKRAEAKLAQDREELEKLRMGGN